ncbi:MULTISPECIES: DUF6722 family protein [Parabacteroides]|jgi:xanthine/uracil permease|uniref:DUF6722 family protein n=1 Tax=Parabacteroides TaxID=375288 RepID=UPI000EFDF2CF|nr:MULTISPECIES: DUF6722 family protein [Parabacteroides]RHU23378.1 hypothetical protein DXD68_19915 [Parabacteroides sp. TM07-1AC]WFE86703.1 hypothetical protein P3L47_08995 [Parabacteroides chongii]
MGTWEKQQEIKREKREQDKIRKESLGKFFYDLAKLTFAAIVLGEMLVLQKDISDFMSWYMICVGILQTYILAYIGNKILKQ